MTPGEHAAQLRRVQGSLDRDESREHRHDVYARHPLARAVPQGAPTVGSLAHSLRELGEMIATADGLPVFGERLAEVERLADLVGERLHSLRALVSQEYLAAMMDGPTL